MQLAAGVHRAQVYNRTLYILAGILALGAVCSALIRPVARKWFMAEPDAGGVDSRPAARAAVATAQARCGSALDIKVTVAWAVVCLPFAWGSGKTLASAPAIL